MPSTTTTSNQAQRAATGRWQLAELSLKIFITTRKFIRPECTTVRGGGAVGSLTNGSRLVEFIPLGTVPPETDLAAVGAFSDVLMEMATLLPAGDHRPSFNWPGCDFSGWPGGPPAPPPPAPITPHTNLTGRWKMLHGGGPTEIVQGANG
eukprot:COSAG03_NODE_12685_length_536_cov_0.835240_1_plen_149_part_10